MGLFSGHETFHIREGWLHKGLKLLIEHPARLAADDCADWLGVGRNMAKSIRYWLQVTGLACRDPQEGRRSRELLATDLARLVWRHDRYFTKPGTWWVLHVNIVLSDEHAASWTWFFNHFNVDRFQKQVCVENFRRHLQLKKSRVPAVSTTDRDIGCLLSTYARDLPSDDADPEDVSECPLSELGLLTHYKHSGYYELDRGDKGIAPHVLCYAFARKYSDEEQGAGVPLYEASRSLNAPARLLVLSSEALFAAAHRATDVLSARQFDIVGMAGERRLQIKPRVPEEWLGDYYGWEADSKEHVA